MRVKRRLDKQRCLFLSDRPLPAAAHRQQEETLHDNCILINHEQAQELHVLEDHPRLMSVNHCTQACSQSQSQSE
jgi:hypothetical protein